MMVVIQQIPFCVANGNVHPGKFLPGIFGLNHFCRMLFDNLIELAIAGVTVRSNFGVTIKAPFYNIMNGFSSQIFHNNHFKMIARISGPMFFEFLRLFGFCHDQNRGLPLTTPAPLKLHLFISSVFGVNRGKEALINFSTTRKSVKLISGSHGGSDLLHHIPNRLVALKSQLALHLFSRESLFGGSHKVNSQEPYTERQIRVFHNGACTQSGSRSALLALKLLYGFHPVVFLILAFSALYPNFLAVFPESIPAGLLIWVLSNKIYKLHIQYFESKLKQVSVTYLRSGI